jgi:hypothetical protein
VYLYPLKTLFNHSTKGKNMPGPSYPIAKAIASAVGASVDVVWNIIKNMRTTDLKKLTDAVLKALRM